MIYLAVLLSIAIHSCFAGSKVVLSLHALNLGASEATVGVLASLYGAIPLVLAVFSGRMADTVGLRAPMLAGAACVVASMLVSALWPGLPALFVTAIVIGAGFILFNVPIQTLPGALGTPAERTRNYGLLSIGYSVSSLVGPTFAGYALEYAGHRAAFAGFAALAMVPLVVLAFFPKLTDVPRQASA
ncbi:MAG: MFS transporter, partial [Vicinamibacterales bacterium]|nr:MFS transporter [Vicinamibacterales bacterium]